MFHQFREKGIRDVRDDKSEHAAATRDQRAGMRVGVKIEFLDGFPHPFCGARADLVRTIDRPRHRGGRDFGVFRNFLNVHRFIAAS